MSDRPTVPAFVVAIAGWVLPGLGYALIGHRLRGLICGVTIVALFALGTLVGSVRVVEKPDLSGRGTLLQKSLVRPWFFGQIGVGPITIATAWAADAVSADPQLRTLRPHARMDEIPRLYTAVAGLLNLLVIIDSASRAARRSDDDSAPAAA